MMDYDKEISALKETVLELLDREEERTRLFKTIKRQYRKVIAEYKVVGEAMIRKDEVFQETLDIQREQQKNLNAQINKLSELEDVLEDIVP